MRAGKLTYLSPTGALFVFAGGDGFPRGSMCGAEAAAAALPGSREIWVFHGTPSVDPIMASGFKVGGQMVAVANGELDLNNLARKELASRGLDKQGQWVGFDKANQIYNA